MIEIPIIYSKFLKQYGCQKWWPVTESGKLFPEYSGGPKTDQQKFEVMLGAILTQNTSWKNVEKAIVELNKNGLVDINKLLDVEKNDLAILIKSAGYYNQKSERLKILSAFLLQNKISYLETKDIVFLRNILLSIKGIGPETCDSIILYALNKPIFVIDAYTKRIFSRLGFLSEKSSYDEWQKLFHSQLNPDIKLFQEYHALIVEHAKQFCKKKPLCCECFLKNSCVKSR